MEEDKFVVELKEGAIRKRLPKAEDLGTAKEGSFKVKQVDNRHHIDAETLEGEEISTVKDANAGITEKRDILSKILQMHKGGKTADEIYNILKSQGHPYQEIEKAMYELVKEGTPPKDTRSHIVKVPVSQPEQTNREVKVDRSEQMPDGIKSDMPRQSVVEIKSAEPGQMRGEIKTEKYATEIPQNLNREFAPLFVKIDKYNETIETLGNLQIYLKEMSKLFELANKLERVRASNISAMNKMYGRCLETSERLYNGLLKPKGMKMEGERESHEEIGKLDDVISDLNKELSVLRDEVDRIKNID